MMIDCIRRQIKVLLPSKMSGEVWHRRTGRGSIVLFLSQIMLPGGVCCHFWRPLPNVPLSMLLEFKRNSKKPPRNRIGRQERGRTGPFRCGVAIRSFTRLEVFQLL